MAAPANNSLFSHDIFSWPDRSSPQPQERRAAAVYREVLRRAPPGAYSDNRWEQVQHYEGVVYVAVRAVMSLAGGATYEVLKRRKPRRNRTTFGPGGSVAKAVATPQQGRDEDYTPLDDLGHPLAKLARRPNPNETFGELAAKVILQNRLTGVGPVWAVPNPAGRPLQLWALKTPYLYPLWQASKQYPNGVWRVMPQATPGWGGALPFGMGMAGAMLPGEEVKRFLEPHPFFDWDGFSPQTAGAHQLDVLEAICESRKSAMDNGLNLDAVIIAPGMDEAALDRLAAKMTEKAGGSHNHRKVAAIAPPAGAGPQDKVLLQTLGTAPKDMDYSSGYDEHTKFALALFGVPAAVAGLTEAGSYSEHFAAVQSFQDRQGQYFGDLENFFTKAVCWPWESFEGEYVFRVKLPPVRDVELLEKQLQTDKGIRTVNERRAQRDLPPVEDGDYPEEIYLKVVEAKAVPKDEPQEMPGTSPGGEGDPAAESADPLAALLSGESPESEGIPRPDNEDAEGSGVPTVGKAQGRREGEVWEAKPGHWRTIKNGRNVPAKNPSAQAPAPKAPKGPTKKEQRQTARDAAAKERSAGRAKVAEVGAKLRDGQAITHEDAAALDASLKHLDVSELKQLNKVIGAKVSVAKAKLIDQAVAHAKALAAGQKSPHAKEKPTKTPKPAAPASPKETPAPAAKPDATPEALKAAVHAAFDELLNEQHHVTGLVPIHQIRDRIRKQFGDDAASQRVLSRVILDARKELGYSLVPISNPRGVTPDQLAGGIPGMGETLFYLEKDSGYRPPKPGASPPPAASPAAGTRAHLDALGVPHAHLSDEEVGAKLRAAFGAAEGPTAKPQSAAKPTANPEVADKIHDLGARLQKIVTARPDVATADQGAVARDLLPHAEEALKDVPDEDLVAAVRKIGYLDIHGGRRAKTRADAVRAVAAGAATIANHLQSQNA